MERSKSVKGSDPGGGLAARVKNIDGRRLPVRVASKNPSKGPRVSFADNVGNVEPNDKTSPISPTKAAAFFSAATGNDEFVSGNHSAGDGVKSNTQSHMFSEPGNSGTNEDPMYDEFGCLKGMPVTADDLEEQKSDPRDSETNAETTETAEADNTSQNPTVVKDNSYASKLKSGTERKQINFRVLEAQEVLEDVDVVLPRESVREVNSRFQNTLFGYFLGKRLAFPVVENYVKNNWARHGLLKVMMNANGFFFFKFNSKESMQKILEGGPWMIRSVPIILNVWSPSVSLKKEDIKSVPVWVKLHDVPMAAYTEDGLSLLGTKLGTPKLLDSYTSTMCIESWGRSSFARALIEIHADKPLKDELVMAVPNLDGEGYSKDKIKIEYEWRPPRCSTCCVFSHNNEQCPKLVKAPPKATVHVDADGFQQVQGKKKAQKQNFPVGKSKQNFVYRPVNKRVEKPEVSTSNAFDVLADHNSNESHAPANDKKSEPTTTGDDSDNDVEEVYNETEEFMASDARPANVSKGASTPNVGVSNG